MSNLSTSIDPERDMVRPALCGTDTLCGIRGMDGIHLLDNRVVVFPFCLSIIES